MIVTISDIIEYLGEGVRPLREGEQLLLAGHITECGYVSVDKKVIAHCRTSKLNDTPHAIEIEFGINSECEKWKCVCSCKAGQSGRCKHVVAILLHLNKFEDLSQLELSCTDIEQSWGKRKRRIGVDVVPLSDYCHVTKIQAKKPLELHDTPDNIRKMLFAAAGDSEGAIHISGDRCTNARTLNHRLCNIQCWKWHHQAFAIFYSMLNMVLLCVFLLLLCFFLFRECSTPIETIFQHAKESPFVRKLYWLDFGPIKTCCLKMYNALYPCDAVDVFKKTLNDKDVWLRERQFRITASTCYSLYTYALDNWRSKSEKYFFPTEFKNFAMKYGIQQEAAAREIYKNTVKRHNNEINIIECGLCVCQSDPWLAATPDALVIENNKVIKLLEIKCPTIGINRTVTDCLPHLKFIDNHNITLRKRHAYYAQVQLAMCLLNLNMCDLVIYASYDRSIAVIPVPIDLDFCGDLLKVLKHNFFSNMLHVLCNNHNLIKRNTEY